MEREKYISLLTLALLISLAANVLAGSYFVRTKAGGYWSDRPDDYALRRSLNDADQKVLETVVDANRKKMDQLRTTINAIKNEEISVTKGETLDLERLRHLLDEERNEKEKALSVMYETRRAITSGMSAEGRATFRKMTRVGFSKPCDTSLVGSPTPAGAPSQMSHKK